MRNSNLPPHDLLATTAYNVIRSLSTPAHKLWWELIKHRKDHSNVIIYKAITDTEKRRVSIAYKELNKLDFILRIKRQHYMINPFIFVSSRANIQALAAQWLALKHKKEGSTNAGLRSVGVSLEKDQV